MVHFVVSIDSESVSICSAMAGYVGYTVFRSVCSVPLTAASSAAALRVYGMDIVSRRGIVRRVRSAGSSLTVRSVSTISRLASSILMR